MWQLLDIAYVIPVTTFVGYTISKYWLHGQHQSAALLIGAACGFVLTFFKIKNYVDSVNKKFTNNSDDKI